MATDEPGYPCIAQRWTGSDDARCVPQPRDAASPVAGRSYRRSPQLPRSRCAPHGDRHGREPIRARGTGRGAQTDHE